MVRLTRRQLYIGLVVLLVFVSAGSWLFLTLRSQEKQPNGATIVQSIHRVEEVSNDTRCEGFRASRGVA